MNYGGRKGIKKENSTLYKTDTCDLIHQSLKTMAYKNTLITIAPDCPVEESELPVAKKKKPAHLHEYELLTAQPYVLDHKSLIFEVYLLKKELEDLSEDERQAIWDTLHSKGQPCMRASALCKRYGFGAHYNDEGKIAVYPIESAEYQKLVADPAIEKRPAMRSKRK